MHTAWVPSMDVSKSYSRVCFSMTPGVDGYFVIVGLAWGRGNVDLFVDSDG